MLVLFAEDERDLAELIIDYLETENIDCDYAFDGENAMNLLSENQYDVIVLDVNMPRSDGFSVCKKLKQSGNDTPVIFLTARDALDDKLTGFELGADDYLTKPFEVAELVARIKVLANRKVKKNKDFQLDTLVIKYGQRQIFRAGRALELTPGQWQLMTILARHSPNVVSRINLENEIWPDQEPSKDMLKMLVFRLRSIVDSDKQQPLIHTIRGAGIVLRLANDQ